MFDKIRKFFRRDDAILDKEVEKAADEMRESGGSWQEGFAQIEREAPEGAPRPRDTVRPEIPPMDGNVPN
ncbi:MAG: hypothetical protein UZ15_CFX003003019 [Chloroflexi bacterium OLB15]|nr:MAG: hypothetical protein UZ15_CFX003003019 [Chloroflexi bacterium OLB15]